MREPDSALTYLLKALVPYTRQNMLLAYRPKQFFRELETSSGYSQSALKSALWRARRAELVTAGPTPQLTFHGREKVQPFISRQLSHKGKLMVIFDIPENRSAVRRQFRRLLQHIGFTQVQLSVWVSEWDNRELVQEAIRHYGLDSYVELYEAAQLFPV